MVSPQSQSLSEVHRIVSVVPGTGPGVEVGPGGFVVGAGPGGSVAGPGPGGSVVGPGPG